MCVCVVWGGVCVCVCVCAWNRRPRALCVFVCVSAHTLTCTHAHTSTHTQRQTDRQTDSQSDRQTDDAHRHTHAHARAHARTDTQWPIGMATTHHNTPQYTTTPQRHSPSTHPHSSSLIRVSGRLGWRRRGRHHRGVLGRKNFPCCRSEAEGSMHTHIHSHTHSLTCRRKSMM